ncbi:MAG: hypothetical protein GX752_06580 [Clostridium sp.]|nr:hypothetical protein [Clostridium sp.]
MKYSTLVINKLFKKEDKTLEETIKLDILNFIRVIHSNGHDFIDAFYDAEYFGDIGMTFKKMSGQVMGIITVNIKSEGRKLTYIFNDKGYELLDDLLELSELELDEDDIE